MRISGTSEVFRKSVTSVPLENAKNVQALEFRGGQRPMLGKEALQNQQPIG
jgi:hypothetical protein